MTTSTLFNNCGGFRDFHDVSLVCGGETFKAHRVILAACSTAFREMIRSGFVSDHRSSLRNTTVLDSPDFCFFIQPKNASVSQQSCSSHHSRHLMKFKSVLTSLDVLVVISGGYFQGTESPKNCPCVFLGSRHTTTLSSICAE